MAIAMCLISSDVNGLPQGSIPGTCFLCLFINHALSALCQSPQKDWHGRHDPNSISLLSSIAWTSTAMKTRQIWGIWKLRPAYSPETPNLGQNRWCFVPCDLEIWWMTLENNRASLLCCFKLCATFHSHWWIQTGVTVRKRPIWVKFDDF